MSIALATAVVTVNQATAERLVDLGVRPDKVGVVANSASLARFDPAAYPIRSFAVDGTVRFIYAGALTPTYELDVVLDALARIAAERPDLRFALDLYGRGDAEAPLRDQVAALGLDDRVRFHGRIPIEDVPAAIAAADIGLAPTRRDRFTDASLSTKLFEYAAMGKPVVATRLPLVERTFPPGTLSTYPPGDAQAMAAAILAIVGDPAAREVAVGRTLAIVRDASWEHEAAVYRAIVERLRKPDPVD